MKEYLNVKEIGKLFGLGIQTIHYYDKIGILKPAYRDETNGYRKYRFDQIYQLASIRYMRKLGYSIEDVRNYQKAGSPEESIRLLKERSEALQAQWEELMRIDSAILRKIQYIEDALINLDVDKVEVQDIEEKRFIPIGTEEEIYIDDSFYFYPTIVIYQGEQKHFGALVNTMPGDYLTGKIGTDSIPAGRYLVGYHKGAYEDIVKRFDEAKKSYPQYRYKEEVISYNIIDQFVEQDNSKYITKFHIQIEEPGAVT